MGIIRGSGDGKDGVIFRTILAVNYSKSTSLLCRKVAPDLL